MKTRAKANWHILQSATLVLVLAAITCSAKGSRDSQSSVSRSHVLHADSVLAPLRPVQNVVVSVSATSTFDAGTGLWIYDYSVTNEPTSQNALETFALRPMWRPVEIVSPAHWMGSYGFEGDSTAVAWSVVDAGPAPPGWNGVQLYQGPYDPVPGQTVTGFRITSRQGPANLSFYAQGFDTLQTGGEDGVESAPTIFVEGVTGTTIGPDINSLVSVDDDQGDTEVPARLLAPAPNPTSSSVTFTFSLAAPSNVVLAVFDAKGRLVRVLEKRKLPKGYHSSTWTGVSGDGRRVAAGVYFLKLTANGKALGERKVVLLR